MIGIAIGNGLSRKGYDLSGLKGPDRCVVGCNWLYFDYEPDVLVAIDSEPVRELAAMKFRGFAWLTNDVPRKHIVMVQPDGTSEIIMEVMGVNGFLGKNSGIIAASYLSKHLRCPKVYMLGFDFFRIDPGMTQNDLYHKGLIGFPRYERAWNKLLADCPHTEFIRVGEISKYHTAYFAHILKGFTYISTEQFEQEVAAHVGTDSDRTDQHADRCHAAVEP